MFYCVDCPVFNRWCIYNHNLYYSVRTWQKNTCPTHLILKCYWSHLVYIVPPVNSDWHVAKLRVLTSCCWSFTGSATSLQRGLVEARSSSHTPVYHANRRTPLHWWRHNSLIPVIRSLDSLYLQYNNTTHQLWTFFKNVNLIFSILHLQVWGDLHFIFETQGNCWIIYWIKTECVSAAAP